MAWQLTQSGVDVFCARHNETFPKGRVCPGCVTDPEPLDDTKEPREAPRADHLPGSVNHEEWFVDISDRCITQGLELLSEQLPSKRGKGRKARKGRKANPALAAKYFEVAIKSRRAAVEITRWREDWQKTEQLEDELRRLRGVSH